MIADLGGEGVFRKARGKSGGRGSMAMEQAAAFFARGEKGLKQLFKRRIVSQPESNVGGDQRFSLTTE